MPGSTTRKPSGIGTGPTGRPWPSHSRRGFDALPSESQELRRPRPLLKRTHSCPVLPGERESAALRPQRVPRARSSIEPRLSCSQHRARASAACRQLPQSALLRDPGSLLRISGDPAPISGGKSPQVPCFSSPRSGTRRAPDQVAPTSTGAHRRSFAGHPVQGCRSRRNGEFDRVTSTGSAARGRHRARPDCRLYRPHGRPRRRRACCPRRARSHRAVSASTRPHSSARGIARRRRLRGASRFCSSRASPRQPPRGPRRFTGVGSTRKFTLWQHLTPRLGTP